MLDGGPRVVAGDAHEPLVPGGAEAVPPGEFEEREGRAWIGLGEGVSVVQMPIPDVLDDACLRERTVRGGGQRLIAHEEGRGRRFGGIHLPAACGPAGIGVCMATRLTGACPAGQ